MNEQRRGKAEGANRGRLLLVWYRTGVVVQVGLGEGLGRWDALRLPHLAGWVAYRVVCG
jgi:hypothetical protein